MGAIAPGGADRAGSTVSTESSPARIQHGALTGAAWTVTSVAVAMPVVFVANVLVARWLGVVDFGQLAYVTAVLAIVVQVTGAGTSSGIVRFGAAAAAQGDETVVDRLLGAGLTWRILVQLPLSVAAALVVLGSVPAWVVGAVLVGTIVPAVFGGVGDALAIDHRTAVSARYAIVINVAVQVSAVLAAWFVATPQGVWATRTAVGGALVPLSFLALSRARSRALLTPRSIRRVPAGFWRFSLLMGLAGVLGSLVYSRSEIVLLQWLGSPQALGVFALAFGVATQVMAPVQGVLGPLIPAAAGLVAAHDEQTVARGFDRAVRLTSIATAGMSVVALPVLYWTIPWIYGTGYEQVPAPFVVLALTAALGVVVSPVYAFVSARGHSHRILWSVSAALVVDLLLAVALIPVLDLWGAVVANVVGQVVAGAWLVRSEMRDQQRDWREMALLVVPWAVAVLAVLVGVGVGGLMPGTLAAAAVSTTVATGLLALVLRGAGLGLPPADIDVLVGPLPPWLAGVGRVALGVISSRSVAGGSTTV
jgi:O-antigen/teichoic acid export membrane protein